jgi:NADH-quinone oxidoreductase subunit J
MMLLATVTESGSGGTAEVILFWVFASIALGSGIAMITLRNIVHAALMLVLNFLCIAGLYLGLQSSFLSIVQIIVYAGAIVVLFLFVIMLLGVDRDDLLGTKSRTRTVGAVMVGVLFAGAFLAVLGADSLTSASACGSLAVAGDADALLCAGMDTAIAEQGDSVTVIADQLFTRWTYPFELSALLLVVATLGALVLGRRTDPAQSEDDLVDLEAEEAFAELAAAHQAANVTHVEGDPVAASEAMTAAAAAAVVEEDHHHGGYGHGDHTGHDHSMLPDESPDATPDVAPEVSPDSTDEDA